MRYESARRRPRHTSLRSARPARRACPCRASTIRGSLHRRATDRRRRSASGIWRRLTATCLPAVTARDRTTSATTATGIATGTEIAAVTATAATEGGHGHLAGPVTRNASGIVGIVTETVIVTGTGTATGVTGRGIGIGIETGTTVTGPGTAGAAGVIEARRCAVTVGTGTRRGQRSQKVQEAHGARTQGHVLLRGGCGFAV